MMSNSIPSTKNLGTWFFDFDILVSHCLVSKVCNDYSIFEMPIAVNVYSEQIATVEPKVIADMTLAAHSSASLFKYKVAPVSLFSQVRRVEPLDITRGALAALSTFFTEYKSKQLGAGIKERNLECVSDNNILVGFYGSSYAIMTPILSFVPSSRATVVTKKMLVIHYENQ